MERQARAYCFAHGTNPYELDQEAFYDICIMMNSGIIGNRAIVENTGLLTTVQINKTKTSNHVKISDVIGKSTYEFYYPGSSELSGNIDPNQTKEQADFKLLQFAGLTRLLARNK